MNKWLKFSLEWGSKILSLVILIQQTTLFSRPNSYSALATLAYNGIYVGVLASLVVLLVGIGFWRKEKQLFVTSLFPLIACVLVGFLFLLQ